MDLLVQTWNPYVKKPQWILRRVLPDIKGDEEISPETLKKMIVTKSDFKEALKEVQPSALREVLVQGS